MLFRRKHKSKFFAPRARKAKLPGGVPVVCATGKFAGIFLGDKQARSATHLRSAGLRL